MWWQSWPPPLAEDLTEVKAIKMHGFYARQGTNSLGRSQNALLQAQDQQLTEQAFPRLASRGPIEAGRPTTFPSSPPYFHG